MKNLDNGIYFNRELTFNTKGGYYDNKPKFNEFYEKDYLHLNSDLHLSESQEKIEIAVKVIDFLIKSKKFNPALIVDVGSGSSLILRGVMDYTEQSLKISPKGLAIDISGAILQKSDNCDDVCKLRADAASLPVDSGNFDFLMMFDLIEHTKYPDLVVEEALRVAKFVLIKTPLERSLFTYFKGGSKRLKARFAFETEHL